ncbi:hypothetical protein L208DRAFT_1378382 [Tricholoma matsutake]|nr:hypothetical protein L208DRAFT_1378382 [Tricholoma matsutake 945]
MDLAQLQNENLWQALEETRSLLQDQKPYLQLKDFPQQHILNEWVLEVGFNGPRIWLLAMLTIHMQWVLNNLSPLLEQDHKLTWYYPQLLHSPSLMHDSQLQMYHPDLIPGQLSLLWLPILGQRSIRWDQVFALVQQPELLWDCWKSSKSLDQYSLEELWTCYSLGEHVFNVARVQTGIKPLLQFVEQYFQSKWHGHSAGDRKKWEHFHEIPEWILLCSTARVVSPVTVIGELEEIDVLWF